MRNSSRNFMEVTSKYKTKNNFIFAKYVRVQDNNIVPYNLQDKDY